MTLTIFQLIALVATVMRLASYTPKGGRYRVCVSLLATVWLGACAAIAIEMVLVWPNAVSQTTALTASLAGASMAAALWCGGNVAELLRKLHLGK